MRWRLPRPTVGTYRLTPHLHAATLVLHNQGMSVLRFDNVSKQYAGGHQALVDVSFDVAPGEMLFVTGHSGAGKSTLLKLIHLDERPSRGAVIFDERNLLKVRGGSIPRHRREVGAVYQDHRLLMDRSIAENVALPLILRGTRRNEIGKRVRSVLERMGLGHREKALPSQLSAGEQQRVGIARAIVGEPKLLVADEPTGNLDPTLAAEIMALFAELPDRGTSVLVVSHDLALLRRMRKRVLILDHGRLVDDISPQDLAE
jgi:cell division transport system ATP-binding protein